MKNNNFLIKQYNTDQKKSLKHNYLAEQFSDYSKIFKDIEKVVKKGKKKYPTLDGMIFFLSTKHIAEFIIFNE